MLPGRGILAYINRNGGSDNSLRAIVKEESLKRVENILLATCRG
jgi:hypothetical protein